MSGDYDYPISGSRTFGGYQYVDRRGANGKQVTVFVELKARFDEENNLATAELMKKAGIRILYSIPGLKVHAKVALVLRYNKKGNKYVAMLM